MLETREGSRCDGDALVLVTAETVPYGREEGFSRVDMAFPGRTPVR